MEQKFAQGTPPLVFMSAKNHVFKVNEKHYVIRLPRAGKYVDIDPEFFKEEDGEFKIFDEESNILYTPSITKVLFAEKKYPDLEFNQFFAPYAIKFEEDEVVIIGQVIDMMLVTEDKEEEDKDE